MNIAELQAWLNERGQNLLVDGRAGRATRAAIVAAFANPRAPAVTAEQITAFAADIGCSERQLRAVAKVESSGGGFDDHGRPKILFERHYFHRLTEGQWSVSLFSNPKVGGYDVDSWTKLTQAACRDPDAAFQSASWGKFQIMGAHWDALDYPNPLAMPWAMRESEAAHYDALVRFVKHNNLVPAIRRLSTDPADNEAFAGGYNGIGFRKFDYHGKLARAMA